jgi:WD40 repeat protein
VLVIAGNSPKTLRKWKNGREVYSTALSSSIHKESIAFSANRKLMAYAYDKFIWVYDVSSGKLIGTRPIREGVDSRLYQIKGMAFSPDGKELAGLFQEYGKKDVQILAWDLAKGDPIRSHTLPVDDKATTSTDSTHLQYTADSNAWVVDERMLIDRETGTQLMRLQPSQTARVMPRLRLFADTLLQEIPEFQSHRLQTVPFDRSKFESTVQSVRGSTDSSPAEVTVNRAGMKAIATESEPAWSVKVGAAPALDKFSSAIPLLTPGKDVWSISLSPTKNIAGVVSLVETPVPYLRKVLRWDRYDIAEKKHLGMVELVMNVKKPLENGLVADQSPSGAFLAIRHPDEPKRVDVFAASGKHPGRFLPYAGEIDWLGFVGDDKLYTLGDGKLT